MVYAQIRNNTVVNTIVVDEESPMGLLAQGFDAFLRIDDLDVVPGVNWSYDGNSFSPPPVQVDDES